MLTRKRLQLVGNVTGSMPAMTCQEFSVIYLDWYKVQYPSSYDRVQRIFKNHILPTFGPKPMNTIETMEIVQWLSGRATKVTPASANKEFKCFKAMFNRAIDWKKIEVNPTRGVKSLPERSDKPPVFYRRPELQALYKASSRRNKAMWKAIANTGLRRQEAQNLQHSWINFKAKQLTIESTNESPTKGKKKRTVPLNKNAVTALKALAKIVDDPVYVFPRMTQSSFSRTLKNNARRAGIPGSLHSLRHSFGANLAMAGVPLRSIQILMGHASIKTTEIYAHLSPGYLKGLTSKIQL